MKLNRVPSSVDGDSPPTNTLWGISRRLGAGAGAFANGLMYGNCCWSSMANRSGSVATRRRLEDSRLLRGKPTAWSWGTSQNSKNVLFVRATTMVSVAACMDKDKVSRGEKVKRKKNFSYGV